MENSPAEAVESLSLPSQDEPSSSNSSTPQMSVEEKFRIVRSIGEECIQEEELLNLLTTKPHPICYDGFEPSGRMHIAQVMSQNQVADGSNSTPVTSLASDNVVSDEHIVDKDVKRSEKRKRGLTSTVWKHYQREELGDDVVTAMCLYCKRKFNGSSKMGTTHLKTHLTKCVHNPKKEVDDPKQPKLGCTSTNGDPSSNLTKHVFDPKVERTMFAEMIAKHDYSFSMSEHSYFRKWVSYVLPTYKFRSRNTVKNDLVDTYEEEKKRIYKEIEDVTSRVSLTTDGWKPNHQNGSFFCVTCHFINDDWELCKRIIAFHVVEYPHNGANLNDWLKNRILEWNIDKKLFSVVVDNASNNSGMLNGIKSWLNGKNSLIHHGDMFHLRCAPHIINLIVKKGLETISGLIDAIKKTVKYLDGSPARDEKFTRALIQTKLNPKKRIPADVDTRWNATYDMLVCALELKDAIIRLADLDPEYVFLPSFEEWERGRNICNHLQLFSDVTKTLSEVKYPTANLYYIEVYRIRKALLEWIGSSLDYVSAMAIAMQEKFNKYWEETNIVLAIAAILDPRYKMRLVEFTCREIFGEFAHVYIDKIRSRLFDIYLEYVEASPSSGGGELDVTSKLVDTSSSKIFPTSNNILEGFQEYVASCGDAVVEKRNELEDYLRESLFPANQDSFDILYWWKNNGPKFPMVANLARDLFAIPASSVPSESSFSRARRVIVDNHASLNSDTVEALMCVNDWLPDISVGKSSNDGDESTEFIDMDDLDIDV